VAPDANSPEAAAALPASGTPAASTSSPGVASSPPAAGAVVPPGSAASTPPSTEPVAPSAEAQVLQLVDAARSEAGCGPLVADAALAAAAQQHSTDMRTAERLNVRTASGDSLLDGPARAVAVARGPADPAAVVANWLADERDRRALMDCGLHSVGIGVVPGPDGSRWTLLLA
jgi:uncharacterized protein YkwD